MYANLSPQPRRKSLKSIQRSLVSFGPDETISRKGPDESSIDGFYSYTPDPKGRKTHQPRKRNTETSLLQETKIRKNET